MSPRWAAAAAVLLSLACLVSVASGFFDGGLGNRELTAALVAYQVLLLAVTARWAGWPPGARSSCYAVGETRGRRRSSRRSEPSLTLVRLRL